MSLPLTHDSPLSILNNVFGYRDFRGQQEQIVNTLCQGQSSLVLMPTGGGKSLCFQIPALYLNGTAIVISPLIALMKDQVDALKKRGVAAEFLNSSISKVKQSNIENALITGKIKILYVSPERMLSKYFLNLLKRVEISLFAIDEAHCVSQWGHDFRPEYKQLNILADAFSHVPRIALTATAGKATQKEIVECLHLQDHPVFVSSFDRPNIKYMVEKKSDKKSNYEALLDFVQDKHPGECGIVYCLSRKSTQEIADYLSDYGLNAYAYHAGMPLEQRQRVQENFITQKDIVVVATIAFGMGIDRADVRFVAHMDLPKCLESYYQETGRAGRDGLSSEAWMLYGMRELVMLKRMGNKGVSSIKVRRANEQKLDAMLGFCETTACRREVLLNYFDDPYRGPCENCDSCLAPTVKKINVTDEALTALTCVYETKQKFNIQYVIEILTGLVTLAIRKNDHLQLSSFAAGKNKKEDFWYSLFRQLIALGYLKMEMDGRSQLKLTHRSLDVLEGREEVWLRENYKKGSVESKKKETPVKKQTRKKKIQKKASALSYLPKDGSEQTLFENLKLFRKDLAKKRRTKSFKIFPDKTLLEMVEKRPRDLAQLEELYGVGPTKLKKYGKIFLQALEELQ